MTIELKRVRVTQARTWFFFFLRVRRISIFIKLYLSIRIPPRFVVKKKNTSGNVWRTEAQFPIHPNYPRLIFNPRGTRHRTGGNSTLSICMSNRFAVAHGSIRRENSQQSSGAERVADRLRATTNDAPCRRRRFVYRANSVGRWFRPYPGAGRPVMERRPVTFNKVQRD